MIVKSCFPFYASFHSDYYVLSNSIYVIRSCCHLAIKRCSLSELSIMCTIQVYSQVCGEPPPCWAVLQSGDFSFLLFSALVCFLKSNFNGISKCFIARLRVSKKRKMVSLREFAKCMGRLFHDQPSER